MQTSERMDKLGYQDLLSKCIQNGLPPGGYSKSSSAFQKKAEPDGGTGRLIENPTSRSWEGTSRAVKGPLPESNFGQKVVRGMDGTAMELRTSPFIAPPNSACAGHIRGRASRYENLKSDEFSRSFLKSREMVTETQPSSFSFRSLLEGAISASVVKPSISVQKMVDSGMRGAVNFEPQKNCISSENYPLLAERRQVGGRQDCLVSGKSMPQSCRDDLFLSAEGVAESWKGEGNSALGVRDSRSSSGDTVGVSVPHVSYSSLLRTQLGDDVDEVRTETFQKTAGASLVNVEAHSSPLNLRLQSVEVEGEFFYLLERTTPLLLAVARRAIFSAGDSVSISEQISDVHHIDKPSHASAVAESQSSDKVSERDLSDSLKTGPVPTSPVLTEVKEEISLSQVVAERGNSLVPGSMCTHKEILDFQLPEGGTALAGVISRSIDIRAALDSSEVVAVPASALSTRIEELISSEEVSGYRGSCVVADSVCVDEEMSDVQLFEALSQALDVDESRFAEKVLNRDAIDSSAVPAKTDDNVSTCGDKNTSGVKLPEALSQDLALHGSAEVISGRNVIDLSDASAVAVSNVSLLMEGDIPRAGLMDNIEKKSYVLVSDEPSHAFVLDESRSAGNFFIGPLEDAGDSASPVPIMIDENDSMSKEVVEREVSHCRDVLMDTEQDKSPLRSFNSCDGHALEERIQSPSQYLVTVKDRLEGQAKLVDAGTMLDVALETCHKETDEDGGSVGVAEFNVCDAQIDCGVHCDSGTDNVVSSDVASVRMSVERVPKEARNEMCDTHMSCPRGSVPPKPNLDCIVAEVLFKRELDVSEVLGSSREAVTKPTEDINSMVGRDREDISCRVEVLEYFMGQDAGVAQEHLSRGDDGSVQRKSCVGSVEIISTTISRHGNGNLDDTGYIHTDGSDQMVSLIKEKVLQDHILRRPEGSSQVKRPEVDHYKACNLEMEVVSRADNMGLLVCGTRHESEELPSSGFPLVEAGFRNDVERVSESLIGQIVNGATESGCFVDPADPADQVLSTDPDVIYEVHRKMFLRDSDGTFSDSLESAQGTGAEFVAGKEVQSPLVTKSKERHARHLDDLEDSHIRHLEDLENPRARRLDDLDEIEDQPRASPSNGAAHDQLVGVEVHPYKKKGRPRAYNNEKVIRGIGRPHFHPIGSKRKNQLQNVGNRCRRNRHIYPDQPVSVFIEGRDEGFKKADGDSFLRWLAYQDEPNAAISPALGKRVRKHGQELDRSIIAIPSFRVVSDYEENQQEVEKRRKLGIQQQPIPSSRPTFVSSSIVQTSEYDMDDEDERWLFAWNKRLAQAGLKHSISEDKFEEMIEYFERRSAEMGVCAAVDYLGFSHSGKYLTQPLPCGSLPKTTPSCVGLLSTNSAISGTPVSGNSPTFNPPAVQPGHPPLAASLKDVFSSGRQAMVSSFICADNIGRHSVSPASTARIHAFIPENEGNISSSAVDAVCETPCDGLLRKSEPSALEKLSDDCCICNGGEDDENNPVYTCKQCLIHVHQSCYGIREKFRDDEGRVIAPSNWCCRKCEAVAVGKAQPNVSCALCRKRGGALKPTVVARKWAHVACALYTNETFFVDPDAMEPIDGIAAVAARAQERQERCGLCGVKRGICSLCAVKDCRAPFHISCGVSQGASFELRQSKQKVLGVRSFCPRHARTSAVDLAPSAELTDRHMLSSSTSGATASATASGSISTASSMDDRTEGSSRQRISHPDGSHEEPVGRLKNVGTHITDLMYNVISMNEKRVEEEGRSRPKGIRFTLKRRWDDSCNQASEEGLLLRCQKKCRDVTGVSGGKVETSGCKSTWHVVESGQKLKKIKFKFGRLAQNLDSESFPTLGHQEVIGNGVSQADKVKDKMPAEGGVCGDTGIDERDEEFVEGLSGDRFDTELKELMILEQAMKSGVAPDHIMREAFVYWRTKRKVFKGSLLCELHHEQWLRSQGIFNKDASDEERIAVGQMPSPLGIPQAREPSPMSNEKTWELAKEIRIQLERVRLMAQMVVQREKLKYNHQLVLGSIASGALNRAESVSAERHCVWCPSIKTLLKCGTCPRSFCFNCFKHRKGFGVKGWMAAMKQPMYICKYCRELSSGLADSSNLDPVPTKIGESGAMSTPGNTSRLGIGLVSSAPAVTSEAVLGLISASVTSSIHVGEVEGNGIGKGRIKGRSWHIPGSRLLGVAEGVVMATMSNSMSVAEGKNKGLGIGRSKRNSWTASDDARRGSSRRGSEDGAMNHNKPAQPEDGLNKFFSSAHSQIEHSSFETTLRRLKILRFTNADSQEVVTSSDDISSAGIAFYPGMDRMEGVTPSTIICGNVSVPSSPGSGPALLVYKKKRRLILGASSESPPSAYDFGDQPCSPKGLKNGTSV